MVVCRKGSENTEGIKFTMLDSKSELFECKVPSADFPAIGEDWKEFVHSPEESKTVKGLEFVYKIRVTGCEDKISDKDTLANFLTDTDSISYSEEVIEGASQTDNALVQCWRHKKLASKAVLWVLGRNDCFMHADVAKTLFTDKGYDLYVLNYSSVGLCRKRGWLVSRCTIYDSIIHSDYVYHFCPPVLLCCTSRLTSFNYRIHLHPPITG